MNWFRGNFKLLLVSENTHQGGRLWQVGAPATAEKNRNVMVPVSFYAVVLKQGQYQNLPIVQILPAGYQYQLW